ncbi:MAG: glycosyltransferase family 2 protein [Patescibacteria group bacterium]
MEDYLKIGKANELANRKDRIIYRSFEILPGFLAYFSIAALILLSFKRPFWAAVFIIAFDIYWIIRIAYFYSHLAAAFKVMKKVKKTDWQEKLKSENLDWQKIYHLVILPFYKEGEEVVIPSIESLAESNYLVKEKMIVVLASEDRAGEEAEIISEKIKEKYGGKFYQFLITKHPKDLSGELAGKGSNTAWAGKKAKELINQLGIPHQNIIASSFDIDTVVPPDYFSRLTYVYLTTEDPLHASYQPVPLYFNNIWEAPFLSRIAAFSTTFWSLLNQERSKRLKTFSSHSMPFKALVDVDFWMTDIVTEDNIIFFQCFLKYDGNYRVIPLYYPVYMDANIGENFFQTTANVYRQHRRWAWGVETIPYMLFGFLKNKKIPLRKKIAQGFDYIESFWSWATSSFIIAIFGWLPGVVGGIEFKTSILALNLPDITGGIGSIAIIALIFSAFFSINLLLIKFEGYKKSRFAWLALQWLFTPLIMLTLIATPAIDAQTRLIFGKYMGFWNTPKPKK